jgi:hypothetical protein
MRRSRNCWESAPCLASQCEVSLLEAHFSVYLLEAHFSLSHPCLHNRSAPGSWCHDSPRTALDVSPLLDNSAPKVQLASSTYSVYGACNQGNRKTLPVKSGEGGKGKKDSWLWTSIVAFWRGGTQQGQMQPSRSNGERLLSFSFSRTTAFDFKRLGEVSDARSPVICLSFEAF